MHTYLTHMHISLLSLVSVWCLCLFYMGEPEKFEGLRMAKFMNLSKKPALHFSPASIYSMHTHTHIHTHTHTHTHTYTSVCVLACACMCVYLCCGHVLLWSCSHSAYRCPGKLSCEYLSNVLLLCTNFLPKQFFLYKLMYLENQALIWNLSVCLSVDTTISLTYGPATRGVLATAAAFFSGRHC